MTSAEDAASNHGESRRDSHLNDAVAAPYQQIQDCKPTRLQIETDIAIGDSINKVVFTRHRVRNKKSKKKMASHLNNFAGTKMGCENDRDG